MSTCMWVENKFCLLSSPQIPDQTFARCEAVAENDQVRNKAKNVIATVAQVASRGI